MVFGFSSSMEKAGFDFEVLIGEQREVLTSRDLRGDVGGDIFLWMD